MKKIMIELDTNYYIQTDIRYKTLVNYLKEAIQKETYINSDEIKKILKALEEVE
jgi:hypothetical protein